MAESLPSGAGEPESNAANGRKFPNGQIWIRNGIDFIRGRITEFDPASGKYIVGYHLNGRVARDAFNEGQLSNNRVVEQKKPKQTPERPEIAEQLKKILERKNK